ncbi:unnamed protein product [Dicrocoelium dendriticum]|nr:unnamed protein product [Dicrocoelium dendriticum]
MPFLHLLVVLFVISCSAVQSLEVPYNYVVGSVVTSCGHPTFHSIPSTPYPAENGYNVSMWTRDPNVRCFQTVGELLTYCQKIYDSTPHGKVNQVVLDPFRHSTPKRPLYSSLIATTNMRRYMCMHSSSPSVVSPDMPLDSLEPPSTVKPAVHSSPMPFPTLIEVHKALFSERLLRLSNETKSNVSQLIHHMITESEGLRHLHNLNSVSAQHLPSSMLQVCLTVLSFGDSSLNDCNLFINLIAFSVGRRGRPLSLIGDTLVPFASISQPLMTVLSSTALHASNYWAYFAS